jgi:diguanylate cyclase (GGDEF)-like protein/PAS domain S-box-containing protein
MTATPPPPTAAAPTDRAATTQRERVQLEIEHQVNQSALQVLRTTLESSPDGIVVVDLDDTIVTCNQRYLALWDIDDVVVGLTKASVVREFCTPRVENPEALALPLRHASDLRQIHVTEVAMKDGRVFERRVAAQTEGDVFCGWVIHWHDITERRRATQHRDQLALVVERSLNEIFLFDAKTLHFSYVNAGARANLGYTLEQLSQMTPVDIKPEMDEAQFRAMIAPLLCGEQDLLKFETVHQRADGSLYDVLVHLQLDTHNVRPTFVALILDITERKKAERQIWDQAHYDALTGLPNRILLQDRLAQKITKAHRTGERIAVMFIDLDRFKEINDTLGHAQGDRLLAQAAKRLQCAVRASDTVARMGGDEFVVLIPELDEPRLAMRTAETIVDTMAAPFDLDGHVVTVSASVGIVLYPDDGLNAESLLRCADQAMYLSKSRGRNCYTFYTPDLEQASQRRLRLVSQMRSGLEEGQFSLNFQPIVDLASGAVDKAEALLRWTHPTLGAIPPAEFIPLAEDSGFIGELGEWVFEQTLHWLAHWRSLTGRDVQISINKSPLQFQARYRRDHVWVQRMRECGLPGHALTIEITEGLLIEANEGTQECLLQYRDAGIQVAIDDFGVGYSALSYLNRLDIDFLKIDRSFIQHIGARPADLTLIEAIIKMAHALGLKVVAEGVETAQQLALLRQIECDHAQGYYFSRPLPAPEFEALLLSGRTGVH